MSGYLAGGSFFTTDEVYDGFMRYYDQVGVRSFSCPEAPPKRQRKPRLDRMIAQAEKATGKTVASITMPDGTTLHFGESPPTEATNPWLADLNKEKQQ